MADTYNTIPHNDLSGGIDARNSEDKLPDSFSEDIVNLDTTTTGQLQLRPGYTFAHGFVPVKVSGVEGFTYNTGSNVAHIRLNLAVPMQAPHTSSYPAEVKVGIWGWSTTRSDVPEMSYTNRSRIKMFMGMLVDSTTLDVTINDSVPDTKNTDWHSGGWNNKFPELWVYGLQFNASNLIDSAGTDNDKAQQRIGGSYVESIQSGVMSGRDRIFVSSQKNLLMSQYWDEAQAQANGLDTPRHFLGKGDVLAEDGAVASQLGIPFVSSVNSGLKGLGSRISSTVQADGTVPITAVQFNGTAASVTVDLGADFASTLTQVKQTLFGFDGGSGNNIPRVQITFSDPTNTKYSGTYQLTSATSLNAGQLVLEMVASENFGSDSLSAAPLGYALFGFAWVSIAVHPWFTKVNTDDEIQVTADSYAPILGLVSYSGEDTQGYSARTSTTGASSYTTYTFLNAQPTLQPSTTPFLIDWEAQDTAQLPGNQYALCRGVMKKYRSTVSGVSKTYWRGEGQPISGGGTGGFNLSASYAGRGIIYLDISEFITAANLANAGFQLSLQKRINSSGDDNLDWLFYRTKGFSSSGLTGLVLYTQDVSTVFNHGIRPWFSSRQVLSGYTVSYPEAAQNLFIGDRIRTGSTVVAAAGWTSVSGVEYSVVGMDLSLNPVVDTPYGNLVIDGLVSVGSVVSRLIPVPTAVAEVWNKPRVSTEPVAYGELSGAKWQREGWAALATWRAPVAITYAGGVNVLKFNANTVAPGEYGLGADTSGVADKGTVLGRISLTTNATYSGLSSGNVQYRDWVAISPSGNYAPAYYARANRSSAFKMPLVSISGNVYSSDGAAGRVVRFDGVATLPAGVLDWQPGLVAYPSVDVRGTSSPGASFAASGVLGASAFTTAIGVAESFPVGTQFRVDDTARTVYTVIKTDQSSTSDLIYVTPNILSAGLPASPTLTKLAVYSYYFRLSVTDWNNNQSVGPAVQVGDFDVSVPSGCGVRLRLIAPPAIPELVAAKAVDILVYRTKADTPGVYYRVAALPVGFTGTTQYTNWLDWVPDILLTEEKIDPLPVSINNARGTGLAKPPAGNFLASASSRLFVADFNDEESVTVTMVQDPAKPGVGFDNNGNPSIGDYVSWADNFYLGGYKTTFTGVSHTLTPDLFLMCATHWAAYMSSPPSGSTVFLDPQEVALTSGEKNINPMYYGWYTQPSTYSARADWYAYVGGTNSQLYKFTAWSGNQITLADANHDLVVRDVIMFLEGPTVGVSQAKAYRITAVAGTTLTVVELDGTVVNASGGTYNSRWVLSRATTTYGRMPLTAGSTSFSIPQNRPNQWAVGEQILFTRYTGAGTASFQATVTSISSSTITVSVNSGTVTSAANDEYSLTPWFYQLKAYYGFYNPLPIPTLPSQKFMNRWSTLNSTNILDYYSKMLTDTCNTMTCVNVPVGDDYSKNTVYLRSGSVYPTGTFVVKSLFGSPVQVSINADTVNWKKYSNIKVYFDGLPAPASAAAYTYSRPTRRASRVAISLKGYPEVFDRPFGPTDLGLSSVDVNPSDGGEIMGLVPFFGKSAFTAAQQEAMLLVFKPDSIYLIDVEAKFNPSLNRTVLQKLQTRNLGCSFKGAVCEVPDGVLFVHTSGVYKLKNDLTIEWIGERLDRMAKADLVEGRVVSSTLWPYRQKVLVGYSAGSIVNNDPTFKSTKQFVYDYTREGRTSSQIGNITSISNSGSWVKYDGPPIQEGVPFGQSLAFISWDGKVYEMRGGESVEDFTDIGQPITFSWTYKANDFGDSGRRKVGGGVVTSFRATASLSGIQVAQASDMERAFTTLSDTLTIDSSQYKVVSLRSSLHDRKFQYLQLKYTGSVSAPIEFTSLDYIVAGLTHKGLKQAATAAE